MEAKESLQEIDFQKHLLVMQRRWLPAVGVFGVFFAVASVVAFSLKPTYKAEGSLLIKTNRAGSLTGLREVGEALGQLEPMTMTGNPLDTQAKIVASVPVIQETINSLNLKDDQGKPLKILDFRKKLQVEGTKGTEVLEIFYQDDDAQKATNVVNKVIEVYIRNNIQANRAEAEAARKFIVQQLPATETSVRKAESELRNFKEQNKVIVLQQEASAAVDSISKLEDDISQAEAQLANVNAQAEKLRKQANVDSQQAVVLAALSQAPGIQELLAQYQETQSQLATAKTRYQPGHPSLVNLQERVSALKNLLEKQLQQVSGGNNQPVLLGNLLVGELRQNLIEEFGRNEARRVGLEQQIAKLSSTRLMYKQRANVLPRLEQIQRELERKLKAAQTTYETLLTRLQEIQVAENQNVGNARVIAAAVLPEKPAGPKKLLIIGAGGIVGILLGVVTAFTLDLLDRSVKTVEEAKEMFKYTLLGVIPAWDSNEENSSDVQGLDRTIPRLITKDFPLFPIDTAYQMILANLKFMRSDKQLKTIVVTSSVSKEGKSEVSANLAVAMAEVGNRVLLVDADMRYPMQHHIWGLESTVGLSNMICEEATPHATVQEVMPNLHVLAAGVLPANPVALLDSPEMVSWFNIFSRDYDFVLFDTPPLAGIPDAAVLSKLADGIVLVARPGVVDSFSANAAKEFLQQSGQDVLGLVINGVNIKQEPYGYLYHRKDSQTSTTLSGKSAITKKLLSGLMAKSDRS